MTNIPAVHAEGLVKSFGDFRGRPTALTCMSLRVRSSVCSAPTVAGKTTMLKMLATAAVDRRGVGPRSFGVDVRPRGPHRHPAVARRDRPVRLGGRET